MVQVHKKYTDDQVQNLLGRYLKHEIERKYIQEILGIGKVRFFALLKEYRKNPQCFSIIYPLNQTVSEIRFWHRNNLIDIQKVKINAAQGVQF
ncbi:MAG: hypothetical protein COW04_07340 [Deltaproteobacteria bacterium CG12_big_fil_rev_8_21_14_0_65_43_10]|nr:MAG: hypothetical protein AUK23_05245 [Deltaproteobacteria bacterium CG2_30_43_15]PIQ45495.1 MAG: hypothetical protein COW04_07340 [Deltaproteobacteria bacterium CG12_big_fil_rev_8_21_14_0_65_43_10]PIU84761.1 MAG: hypothetical protein COS67_11455 [Deltaproteobacteria bacterium CG06_land_8_20_14_3_00_44_19]PIX25354.1 MAG: hypothetical protein COZ68_04135 [Deltaproteobacteria bacterium CG_4_8_14_3_um_filter_43_13]PIZ18599.1 MAG: hypothetical protein COY50_14490 [Deltaproteobacteria bacterium C